MWDAVGCVLSEASLLGEETIPLKDAGGRFLAMDAVAPWSFPPFDAAISDGYAVHSKETSATIVFTVLAGHVAPRALGPGECAYVATGAPMPEGADAVVKQEFVTVKNDMASWTAAIAPGTDIRPRGSDHKNGEVLVHAGTELRPWDIGLLATTGKGTVGVRKRPTVFILSTGDELRGPGDEYDNRCQIYDANRAGLMALCKEHGALTIDGGMVKDDPAALKSRLNETQADVILVSGGASGGKADFAHTIFSGNDAVLHFSQLHMKPGKPTTFGTRRRQLIFGLPGNPVSALVTCELLVAPALRKLQGARDCFPSEVPCRLDHSIQVDDRPEYRRVSLDWDNGFHARSLGLQRSSRLASFRGASALACVPDRASVGPKLSKGTQLTALLLGPLPRQDSTSFFAPSLRSGPPIRLHIVRTRSLLDTTAIVRELQPCTAETVDTSGDFEAILNGISACESPALVVFTGNLLATDSSSLDAVLDQACPRKAPGLAFAMSTALQDPLIQPFAAVRQNLLVLAIPDHLDKAMTCLRAVLSALRPALDDIRKLED